MLLWLIIFELRSSKVWRRWLAVAASYAYLVTAIYTFRLPPYVDYHWSNYAPALDQGKDVWMPINPPGWRAHFGERKVK
ncbi:MAG: hypothetical protein QM790_06470 [Nibricoccus sp.]